MKQFRVPVKLTRAEIPFILVAITPKEVPRMKRWLCLLLVLLPIPATALLLKRDAIFATPRNCLGLAVILVAVLLQLCLQLELLLWQIIKKKRMNLKLKKMLNLMVKKNLKLN